MSDQKNFRRGVCSYFKKYQWGNASLNDFIYEIASSSGKELETWSQGWLQSAGLNSAKPVWHCDDNGLIKDFLILQEPTVSGKFLTHRTRIGFFERTASGDIELYHVIDPKISSPKNEITDAIGLKCPAFVYTNMDSQDYIFATLDSQSLELSRKILSKARIPSCGG